MQCNESQPSTVSQWITLGYWQFSVNQNFNVRKQLQNIFVLHFIINSDKLSTDCFSLVYFHELECVQRIVGD